MSFNDQEGIVLLNNVTIEVTKLIANGCNRTW